MKKATAKKVLRLTVEVPGFYADDLDELAAYCSEPDPPGDDDRLYIVTEEWMRPDVILVVTSYPGEKCGNDDFETKAFPARIVAAAAAPTKGSGA